MRKLALVLAVSVLMLTSVPANMFCGTRAVDMHAPGDWKWNRNGFNHVFICRVMTAVIGDNSER